ncbi:MAG: 30S ribosomal protein S8 [Acidobacteriota bacterium]|jgi:small subunit ribosomal protein S8
MSMSDPIADMLTRIRNAHKARHRETDVPFSRLKSDLARVLQEEGYIEGFRVREEGPRRIIRVALRYTEDGDPVVSGLQRASRPGRRNYTGAKEIPRVLGGLGICVLSTSQGVMSDREARRRHVGGEVLCNVW